MGKLKIESEKKKIKLKKIEKAVYKYLRQTDKLKAELVFVTEDEIKALNLANRKIDAVTDVLSFPSLDQIKGKILKKADYPFETEKGYVYIGSIAICEKRCAEQAVEFGHSLEAEMTYLTIHGLLHLMGYDHMEDADKREMRVAEKAILVLIGIGEEK